MKNFLQVNQLFGTVGSSNQTDETLTRENRIGLKSYLRRTLMLLFAVLVMSMANVGTAWADEASWKNNTMSPASYFTLGSALSPASDASVSGYTYSINYSSSSGQSNNKSDGLYIQFTTTTTTNYKIVFKASGGGRNVRINTGWTYNTTTSAAQLANGATPSDGIIATSDQVSNGSTGTFTGSNLPAGTYYICASGNLYIYEIEFTNAGRRKITYKANGGTGDDVVREYLSGTTVYVAPNYMFSRSGYIFTGWNTKADGSGTHFDFYTNDASYYHQSLTLTKDTVLFAKWKAEETTNSATRYCISVWNSSNNGKPYFTQKIGDKDEYMMNYTVPDKDASNNWPKYWVGKNDNFYNDNLGSNNNSKSVEDELADISIKSQRSRKLGLAAGALGTLHINDRSGDDNLYICFLPKRYGIVTGSGALASSASGIAFYTTEFDNEWITDMVQMTSTMKSGNYYVGFMKSDGTFVKSEATDRSCISVQATMSSMGIYVRGTGWSANQVGTEIADDSYGAFRLWSNTDQNNFQCHWVPYYGLKYNANGGTGAPALTGVAQEGSNAQRTIKVSTTEPTRNGYSFEGWATSSANASAGTKAYDPGDDIKLSADVELFAIWSCVDPTITTDLSEDQVDYYVGNAATALTVAATAAGGSVSYQWYSNDEANTTTPTTLTTGASYTPSTAAAGTTYYYCVITNSTAGCSTTATSSFAKIVVSRNDPTKYDFTATSASICSGEDATFTLSNSQVGATYYITKSSSGGSAIGDSKAGTGSSLSFTATSATTGDYYCYTTETTAFNAIKVSKNKATISYKTATGVTVDDATLDNAVVGEEYTISGITGAGAGSLTYQWYSYSDDEGNDETEIDGAEDDTYAFTPDTEGDYYFKCEVKGDCGSVKSELITVTATAAVTYSVTYKANGGTGEDVTNDPETTISSNSFTAPATKAFVGWNTEPDGTGTPYAVGDAVDDDLTLYAQWRYKVYYIYKGDSEESNDITTALASKYVVSKHTTTGTSYNASDYSDYALIVLSESLNGGDAKTSGHELKVIKGLNKPILNLKSFFYNKADNDHRWDWGTPNAGKKPKCIYVKNSTYANLTSHPIYSGLTPDGSDSIQILKTPLTTKPIQPVGEFASGYEGYTLALVPNNSSGSGTAIHEMTAAQRSSATGETITSKYLMISIQAGELSNLSDNGKTLIKNAADYLITGSQWVPQYTITYDKGSADGASGDSFTGTKTHGTSFSLSSSTSAFTRSGYTYDGWSTSADGSTKDYNLGGSYTTDAAITLYPHWVLDCTDAELAYGTTAVEKTYGAAAFTNALTNENSAGVTYSSTNTSVATVESDGEVTIVGVGETTIKATLSGDATYCDDEVSYTLTVAKADLSVSPAAGTATSVTHNSATLPFTLASTTGVASVTLKVYLNSDNSLVKTVSGVTAATSGSGEVTELDASTTYYFTVTPIGDANHNDGAASSKSSTFTTEAAPTLTALVEGTLYEVPDMIPDGASLTSSDQFFEGLSANARFELIGSASGSTTPKVNNNSSNDKTIAGITFDDGSMWFNREASLTSNIPTTCGLSFITPGTGKLYLYFSDSGTSTNIKLAKSGSSGSKQKLTDGYAAVDVTGGTYYLYGTSTSSPYSFYGMKFVTTYDVTLKKNTNDAGSTGGTAKAPKNGTQLIDLSAPTRTGYSIEGYYAEPACTNKVADDEGNFVASVTISATSWTDGDGKWVKGSGATLYAKWEADEYSVTYADNGKTSGSVPTDATTYHYGDEVEVADNTGEMTKTGYTFVGWTYNGTFYQAGDKITITEDVTLTAVWKSNSGSETITLTHFGKQYDTSDGSKRHGFAYVGSTSGTKYVIESNDSNNKNSSSDSTSILTKYNTFVKVLGPGATASLSDSLFSGVSSLSFDWFLYNASSSTTTTVDVYVGGTKVLSGAELTGKKTDDYATKTISGIESLNGAVKIVNKGSSSNYNLYLDNIAITYTQPVYTVSFDNMTGFGGTATLPDAIVGVPSGSKILQPADPTTTGNYVFGGWYKEGSCTNAWDFASDQVTSATTLYAKWYDADHTVTWKVNGETYATTKVCGDVDLKLPTPPADNTLGCANSFRGWSATNWYGEATSTQPSDLFIDVAGAPTIDEDKTFYAVFGTATDAAKVGTVLWSENWTGAAYNSTPDDPSDNGSVVYGDARVGYTWVDGTGTGSPGTSKVYNGTDAGGVTPEAFIGKTGSGDGAAGGYLTISGIPRGNAKIVTVEYKANANRLVVSVSGTGYSGSNSTNTKATHSFDVTCGTDETFSLTFTATTTSNVRLDDIVVKVKEDGATDYHCICPSLKVTPELVTANTPIFITSSASASSKTVRSQDRLHIVGTGLDKNATLSLSSPASKFVLKSESYTALTTDETGEIDTYAYIFYTPDAGDTSDGLDKYSTFTVTDGSNDAIVDQALIGRHLPADFVIVAKNGDKWYALPADMSSESNPTPAEIAVDDKENPTVAYSANTNIYNLYGQNSGAGYLEEAGQYIKLGMKNNSNYPLYGYSGSKTSIKGNSGAIVTNNIGADHWWLLTQTNTSANVSNPKDARYTIANASNEKTLSAWFAAAGGPKWGLYAAGNGEHTLRILPVSSTVGFAEAEIVAWGKNSAIVEVDNSTMIADYAIAKLPEDIASSAVTLSQTRTSVKGTGTRYNYTMDFGEGVDFSANEDKMLTLEWYDALDNLKAVSNIIVPRIVAENTTINKTNYGTKGVWNKEVHVLPGVTVTVDADYSPNPDVTIKELVIYPGAKVVANTGTLKATTLVLRNGWNRLTAETEYNIAQLYITPTTGNLQATNAYADWYIDYDQYYPIAVPWKVATANISYRNMTVDIDQGLMIRYYNGSRHAGVSVDGTSNWTQYKWDVDMPANLEPGIGYAITARRPAGKAFSIIRMPLTIPSTAWTTAGEQGNVEVDEVTTHKDEVTVTAWAKDDGSTPDHAKGWNFVANPYMASYEGAIAFTPTVTPEEDYEDEIAYVSIPDVNFKEFEQVTAETAELKPGCGFLIQTEYNGKITFATESRKADAPYRTTTPKASKQKAYILLSGDEAIDQMGLIIADRYTEDYELNADLEKLLSDGNTLRTYMQYNDLNMAYVAINSVLAQEWIPVSVRVPAAGEYTYSIHRASRVDELEGLYLIDYETSEVTNLLENDYVFTAEAGTITDRFAINAIYGPRDTPTDIDVVSGGGDIQADHPIKFLYQDKIYIYYRGVIYDAAGKKVAERRAAL